MDLITPKRTDVYADEILADSENIMLVESAVDRARAFSSAPEQPTRRRNRIDLSNSLIMNSLVVAATLKGYLELIARTSAWLMTNIRFSRKISLPRSRLPSDLLEGTRGWPLASYATQQPTRTRPFPLLWGWKLGWCWAQQVQDATWMGQRLGPSRDKLFGSSLNARGKRRVLLLIMYFGANICKWVPNHKNNQFHNKKMAKLIIKWWQKGENFVQKIGLRAEVAFSRRSHPMFIIFWFNTQPVRVF